jgi:hypothetical protein
MAFSDQRPMSLQTRSKTLTPDKSVKTFATECSKHPAANPTL